MWAMTAPAPRHGLPVPRDGTRANWARYWRSGNQPIEAMHAHFSGHVYHRHSHDTYSLGGLSDSLTKIHTACGM